MGHERNRRRGVGVSVLKVNSLSVQWRMSGRNEKNERTFISVLLHLSNYAPPRTSASLQAAKQKITQKTETVMSGRSHTSPCLSLSEYWKCMRWKLKVIKKHCQPHNMLSQLLHHTRCFRFYSVLWKLIKEACQIRTCLHHNAEVTWKNKPCKVEAKLDITKIFMFGIPTESWAFKVQSKIINFTQNQNWRIPLSAW